MAKWEDAYKIYAISEVERLRSSDLRCRRRMDDRVERFLLRDVLGEETVSSRLVIGVASLLFGSPVELEVILEVQG